MLQFFLVTVIFYMPGNLIKQQLNLQFSAKSKQLTTSRSIKTRDSLARAYVHHDSNPYTSKKAF